MPILIDLRLKASWTVRPDTRQLHGLACALFEDQDTDHMGHGKPFAVWPLSPAPPGVDHDWEWRTAWLPAALPTVSVLAPEKLRLGHVTCLVTEARHRSASHAQLTGGAAPQTATVEFRSPAYFSQNATDVVLPDPRLIAGSWRRRWNASLPESDPLAVGEVAWRDTHRFLRLAEFNLRTEKRDSGRGHDTTGFVGSVTLRLAKERFRSCHPDHLATGTATLQAIYPDASNRFALTHLRGEGLEPWTVREAWLINSPRREINHYVDITATFGRKVAAVAAHVSQIKDPTTLAGRLRERIVPNTAAAGLPEGRLAEAFQVVVTG